MENLEEEQNKETVMQERTEGKLDYSVEEIYKSQIKNNPLNYSIFFLEMKSKSSFLLACSGEGMELIEDGQQIFSVEFQEGPGHYDFRAIFHIQYIPKGDYYLILANGNIFIKKIDQYTQPFLFLPRRNSFKFVKKMHLLNPKTLLAWHRKGLVLIDLCSRRITFELKTHFAQYDQVFSVHPLKNPQRNSQEFKILVVSQRGSVSLYSISVQLKKVCKVQKFIDNSPREMCKSLVVCPKSGIAVIEKSYSHLEVKYLTINLNHQKLSVKSHLSSPKSGIGKRVTTYPIKWKKMGKSPLFMRVVFGSKERNDIGSIITVDTETKEVEVLEEDSIDFGDYGVFSFFQLEGFVYYCGMKRSVRRMKIDTDRFIGNI